MDYYKRDGDLEYRRVNVDSDRSSVFQSFGNETKVTYNQDEVLEVRREGLMETVLVERPQRRVTIQTRGDKILIPVSVNLARMWVVSRNHPDVWYKIPDMIPEKNGFYEILIPGGVHRVTVTGDRYFLAAHQIQ